MRTIILLLLGAICQSTWAQVDHFTGDFTHSVPVVTVPSPDGPSIPVSLNYTAGIRVLQEASWIGQGWNMNLGQITRDLKGIPDDWRGRVVERKEFTKGGLTGSLWLENAGKREQTTYYGPVYFKDFNDTNPLEPNSSSMDTYVSIGKPNGDKKLATFEYPDYDDFYVSAPNGKGGVMKAFLFEDKGGYLLHKKTPSTNATSNDGTSEFITNNSEATNHSAQFIFKDEQSNLYAPKFTSTSTQHTDPATGLDYCNGNINQSGAYSGDFNSNGTVKTGRQVNYYTNRQINQANGQLAGFIECPEMIGSRKRNDHTIGAFSVKMGNGFTYYYSLPVYRLNETNYHLEKDDNGNFNKLKATIKNNKYATSWKLTAITGPDYSDQGEQGFDEQDKGYWVVYRYAKYADNQPFQVPFKGGNKSFNEQANYGTYKTLLNYEFKENEAVTIGQTEVYYPEYIQTSTHTALFVKSLRKDGFGTDQSPQLKLDRVVLLRNEDVNQLTNYYSPNNYQAVNGLTTANVNMDQLLHDGVWSSRYNAVKDKVLGAMEFTQDYSLMPGHYHNIDNQYQVTTTEQVNGSNLTYEKGQVSGNGGVLTLKALKTYGYKHESHIPKQTFTYGNNPRFDQDKEDIWGFYKSDYTPSVNHLYSQIPNVTGQDAWSLSEIKSPTGGKMIIHYEADRYSKVRHEQIQRAFEIEQVSMIPGTQKANLTLSSEFYDQICTQNNNNNLDTILVRQPFFYQGNNCNAPSKGFGHKFYNPNASLNWGNTGYINCQNSNTQLYLNAPYAHSGCTAVPVPPTIAPENGSVVLYLKSAIGGGLRVKAIETVNGDGTSYQTEYTYEGGVAGSEPERIMPANFNGILKNYVLYDRLNFNPAVGYSKVTIRNKGANNSNGPLHSELHFNNYNGLPSVGVYRDHKLLQRNGTNSQITCGNFQDFFDVNFALIRDYKAYEVLTAIDLGRTMVGKVNKRITYDEHHNILSHVKNVYETYNNLQESFRCNKKTRVEKFYNPYFYTADGIVDQYHIPMETFSVYNRYIGHTKLKEQISYSNGTKRIVKFDYDRYSGVPTQSTTYNTATGKSTVVSATPAYQLPQYADMGLSTEDQNKTNFLYQSGDQIITIDDEFHDGMYQTYKTSIPTRKHSGNGFITQTVTKSRRPDKTYVSNGQANTASWKKAKETTLFNEKGDVLEVKNDVNRYAATKYGYNNQYALVSLANARYEEFTYSGAEDLDDNFFGGEVAKGSGRLSTDAHSGNYALELPSGRKGFIYQASLNQLDADRKYQARVWTKQSTGNNARLRYTIQNNNGQTVTSGLVNYSQAIMVSGQWRQLVIDIIIPAGVNGTLTVECENASARDILLDDFRFHPKDSPLTTYVYDPIRGFVTHVLNKENMYSRMEYDVHGRVHKTYIETTNGEKLVTETTYNYKQ